MTEDDIDLLIRAYQTSATPTTRFSLLRLIEGLTLNRFVEMPDGPRAGWGEGVSKAAIGRFETWLRYWVDQRCRISPQRMLRASLEKAGARGVDPGGRDACVVWQAVLKEEYPPWWALAARRLYECGGPWLPLEVLQAESPTNKENREWLLKWYRINASKYVSPDRESRTARPPTR